MKNLAKIEDAKDIITKEYLATSLKDKVSESDFAEFTEQEIQTMFEEVMQANQRYQLPLINLILNRR